MFSFKKIVGAESPRSVALALMVMGATALWVAVSYFKVRQSARAPASKLQTASDTFDLFVTGIYKSTTELGKLPVDLAKPFIIRYKLIDFVHSLDLENAVSARVIKAVQQDSFVDAVIPFIISLKEQYSPDSTLANATEKFSSFARRKYRAKGSQISGLEHDLFHFSETPSKTPAPSAAPLISKEQVGFLVKFYDLIFLESATSPFETTDKMDPAATAKGIPIVRKLIESFAKQSADGEMKKTLDGLIRDADAMESITASLIFSLRSEIKKNYRAFSARVTRNVDLKWWMKRQLTLPNQGHLWNYLEYAATQKRYGVQIVVDGLEGHLLQTLSSPASHQTFLDLLLANATGSAFKKPDVAFTAAAPSHLKFLEQLHTKERAEDANYLPFFKNLYNNSPNSIAVSGVSTTPTISVRNLPVVKTGAAPSGPGSTGIPNFHFVDRNKDRAFYFYGNDALLLESLSVESGMKTMFERLSGVSSLNCNAQYDRGAKKTLNAFFNLVAGEKSRDIGELNCVTELKLRLKNEIKLRALRKTLLLEKSELSATKNSVGTTVKLAKIEQGIDALVDLEEAALPQYLLVYDPWPDHFAHFKGPFSDEVLSPTGELNRLDYWLRQIEKIYHEAEVYDRTLWAMAGDHGLAPVHFFVDPDTLIFGKVGAREMKMIKISSNEGEGPKLNNPLHPKTMHGFDAVVASTAGGNYVIDLFKDQNEHWAEQPLYKDLLHLHLISGKNINFINQITQQLKSSLDYLAVRESACTLTECQVRVIGPDAGAWALISMKDRKYFYESPDDLLELRKLSPYQDNTKETPTFKAFVDKCLNQPKKSAPATWCSGEEWQNASRFHSRPDAVKQLALLYTNETAGTINLFPKAGYGYNTEVPGRHAGELFFEKDAWVGFWGTPVKPATALQSAMNGSLAPTIYEYLTGRTIQVGTDGWGYPSLMEALNVLQTNRNSKP